jgi:peptidyl-prolyl cis-trans isomerase B (cyclophilin B)
MLRSLLLVLIVGTLFSCKPKKELILIETDFGNMKIDLYDSTPLHKENFIKLTKEGFYDGLLFHRVINQFMIQGGDPDSKGAAPGQALGAGGPGYTIDAEIGAHHFKGVLAAARRGGPGNPEKKSSGSQFYIVHGKPVTEAELQSTARQKGIVYSPEDIAKYLKLGGTPFLDNDYTAFGEVVEGMDVLDKIAAVQTAPGDRPIEDVVMKVKLIK